MGLFIFNNVGERRKKLKILRVFSEFLFIKGKEAIPSLLGIGFDFITIPELLFLSFR